MFHAHYSAGIFPISNYFTYTEHLPYKESCQKQTTCLRNDCNLLNAKVNVNQ